MKNLIATVNKVVHGGKKIVDLISSLLVGYEAFHAEWLRRNPVAEAVKSEGNENVN